MEIVKNQQEYLRLLEEYWDSIESSRQHYPNKRVEYIAQKIRGFKKSKFVNIKVKVTVAILGSSIASIFTACVMIWGINEVMQLSVPYSFKNIVIVSSLFFVGKMKLKFLESN